MRVCGQDTKFIVDTGASVTIVSEAMYNKIPSDLRPPLQEMDKNRKLIVADQGTLAVAGLAELTFTIGEGEYKWRAYVAPICEDGLLGMDFLCRQNFRLDSASLTLGQNKVMMELWGSAGPQYSVHVQADTLVPAWSEIVLETNVKVPDSAEKEEYLLEPDNERMPQHVLIARAFVTIRGGLIPTRIMNVSSEDIVIYANTALGRLEKVEEFRVIDTVEYTQVEHVKRVSRVCVEHVKTVGLNEPSRTHKNWTEGLQTMYDTSGDTLSLQQKQELRLLVDKHANAFAKSPTDLGCTDVIKHAIDTGDARPVKQRARRPPMAFAQEEDQIIQQQLEAGVIRESMSAWASPLVYVKKKDGGTRACVDFRRLNELTVKDAYPLPRMDDCLDCLGGATFFSTLDLQSGYW